MRWGVAGGLAAALALSGAAQAQSPGTSSGSTAEPGKETTSTKDPGERSGWSGTEANRTGTNPSGQNEPSTSAGQRDTSGTAGSAGSTGSDASARHAASGQGKVDKKLQEQIQKIHASNRAEVHMAQMGQQQATSPEVKQFAQQLEQDHQQLDTRLTQVAQSAGIALEGKAADEAQKDADKHMKKLQGKTGREFDEEFVSMMVKDHEKDIKAVEKAAKDAKKANHAELASTLEQAKTGMQGHLATAKQLEDAVKSGKQSRGTSGAASTGSGSTGAGTTGAGSTGAGATGQGHTGSPTTGAGDPATSDRKSDTTGNNTDATQPKSGGY
jgi:putative membrane protein